MEERERVRRRRIVIVSASVGTGAMVLAALSWTLFYRSTYGTFAWWKIPPRIEYCGREYDRGSAVGAGTFDAHDGNLVQVLTIEPAGRPVYAKPPPPDFVPSVGNLPCAMGLLIKDGDSYIQYGLSGGP